MLHRHVLWQTALLLLLVFQPMTSFAQQSYFLHS